MSAAVVAVLNRKGGSGKTSVTKDLGFALQSEWAVRHGQSYFVEQQERGKAAPGDRTMLDALAPAVAALQAGGEAGAPLAPSLAGAARAAAEGAEATRTMRAKVGRAGWLAERAAGNVDAGAALVALILAAASRQISR